MSYIILDGVLHKGSGIEIQPTSMSFAYGFGVFETIKFLERRPCFLREHLERLRASAQECGLAFSCGDTEVAAFCLQLFEAESVSEGIFKIIVFEDEGSPRYCLFLRDRVLSVAEDSMRLCESAVRVASMAFTRSNKTLNYMEPVLEMVAAKTRGFDDCFYLNEHGALTECSVSNLLFLKGGKIFTAATDCGVLSGVIRKTLLQISSEVGLEVCEGAWTVEDLKRADEVLISNSGMGMRSVDTIRFLDGQEVMYARGEYELLRQKLVERELASTRREDG